MMKKAAWLRRSSKDCSKARPSPRWTAGTLVAALLATLPLGIVTATPASAELRLCNKTESQVGVAIGYREDNDWVTEGWWNLPANTCETLVAGGLVSRFYYIYAVDYDQFGEWGGRAFMCTREKEFTIRGSRIASRVATSARDFSRSIPVSRAAGQCS